MIEQGLSAQLEAMTDLVKVTEDEEWLKKHTASELAFLFGVISDKTFRVIAAIERE